MGLITSVLTFDTTHHALLAEEIAQELSIAYEIVPAPAEAKARCDIAIEVLPESVGTFTSKLERMGVAFRVDGHR